MLARRLRTSWCPPFVRRLFLQCIVYPSFTHGIEVWGPTATTGELDKLSRMIGSATNALMLTTRHSSHHASIKEWDAKSVRGVVRKAVARAAAKWPTLNTWIAILMRFPVLEPTGRDPAPVYMQTDTKSLAPPPATPTPLVPLVSWTMNGTWTRSVIAEAVWLLRGYDQVLRFREVHALPTPAQPLPWIRPGSDDEVPKDIASLWLSPRPDMKRIESDFDHDLLVMPFAAYSAVLTAYCGNDPTVNRRNDAHICGMEAVQGFLSAFDMSGRKTNVETCLQPLLPHPNDIADCHAHITANFPSLPDEETRKFHAMMSENTPNVCVTTLVYRTLPDVPRLSRTLAFQANAVAALMALRTGVCEGMSSHSGLPCMHCKQLPSTVHVRAYKLPWAHHVLFDCTALETERASHVTPLLAKLGPAPLTPLVRTQHLSAAGTGPLKSVTLYWPSPISFLVAAEPVVVGFKDIFLDRVARESDVIGWYSITVNYY